MGWREGRRTGLRWHVYGLTPVPLAAPIGGSSRSMWTKTDLTRSRRSRTQSLITLSDVPTHFQARWIADWKA